MAVDLKDIEKKKKFDKDLEIKLLDTEECLKQWATTVSLVFVIKVDFELLQFMWLQPEVKFYIDSFKSTKVSTLMLYLTTGV